MHCVDGEFDVKAAHAYCNTFAFICSFVVGSLEVMEEQRMGGEEGTGKSDGRLRGGV